jgi:hypothetical protein
VGTEKYGLKPGVESGCLSSAAQHATAFEIGVDKNLDTI